MNHCQLITSSTKHVVTNIEQRREYPEQNVTKQVQDLSMPGDVLNNRFTIVNKIAAGAYGQIYIAKDKNNDKDIAIKMESAKGAVVQLPIELMVLKKYQGKLHATDLVGHGCDKDRNYIAMQLVGPNLNALRSGCPKNEMRFSGSTAIRIFAQCLEGLRDLHTINFLHRDIKPANLAIGLKEQKDIIYLLDFGLARLYRDESGQLRPPRPWAGIRGTLKYCSVATLRHEDLCRRDDLISLFYVFIDIYTNMLPWLGVKDNAKIIELKDKYDVIWLSSKLPSKLKIIATHINALSYNDNPNYDLLLKLIDNIMIDNNIAKTAPWDWEDNFESINNKLLEGPADKQVSQLSDRICG